MLKMVMVSLILASGEYGPTWELSIEGDNPEANKKSYHKRFEKCAGPWSLEIASISADFSASLGVFRPVAAPTGSGWFHLDR
jgi:hypothetical protein